MSLTLAVDCSVRWLNLGLADDKSDYGSLSLNVGRRQSSLLPIMVRDFLNDCSFSLNDIRKIAVSTGPGYYTGIRVGMSYASSLAYALSINVVPVNTLLAVAHDYLQTDFLIVPVIKASKSSLYSALYKKNDDSSLSTSGVFTPEELAASIKTNYPSDRVLVVGEDAMLFDDFKRLAFDVIPHPYTIGLNLARLSRQTKETAPWQMQATYCKGF